MNEQDAKITSALISKHFGIEQNEILPTKSDDIYEQLLKAIERVVSYLLEKDLNRLLNGLYVIDVDEKQFKEIIAHSEPELVSRNVAKLILDRELKKVAFRKKYS